MQDSKWVDTKQARGHAHARRGHPHLPVAGPHPPALQHHQAGRHRRLQGARQRRAERHRAHAPGDGGALERRRPAPTPAPTPRRANILKDYLTKGRFPENNDVLPKTPGAGRLHLVPHPARRRVRRQRARVHGGRSPTTRSAASTASCATGSRARAANIVNAVRTRFNKMHIVKWRVVVRRAEHHPDLPASSSATRARPSAATPRSRTCRWASTPPPGRSTSTARPPREPPRRTRSTPAGR